MRNSPICANLWKRSEFDAFGIYLRRASILPICVNSELGALNHLTQMFTNEEGMTPMQKIPICAYLCDSRSPFHKLPVSLMLAGLDQALTKRRGAI